MDLNDYYLFAKIVEHGGYNAAARALDEQASKLSRRVTALEESLGVRLLNRTTRKISLTEAGRAFYARCQNLAAEADAARRAVMQTMAEPSGILRISCPVGILHSEASRIANRFLIKYPKTRLMIEATNRRVDVIEEGFDVALRARSSPMDDADVVARALAKDCQSLVASPTLVASLGMPDHLLDFTRYPTLSMLRTDKQHWTFLSDTGEEIKHTHEPRMAVDDLDALRLAAIDGVGATCLPDFLIHEDLAQGKLVRLLPQLHLPQGSIYAVFPSRKGMTPAARAFIDELVLGFEGLASSCPNSKIK